MNYGIVGLGKQGQQHLAALQVLNKLDSDINIIVCDIDDNYINTLSSKLGVPGYSSCKQMLERNKIDILILALPNDKYEDILKLENLENVMVIKEKPFAINMTEADSYINLMDRKKIKFNVVQNRFFSNHYITAKKWFEDGLVGDTLFFDYRYTLNDRKESWYWDKKSGGGCWLNVGWHFAFIVEWFFGTPQKTKVKKIKSSKQAFEYDTDDTVFVECMYGGFTGTAYMSVADSFKEDSFKIVGSNGTIHVSKENAVFIDNDGNVKFKEKAEGLLSYMTQIKYIFNDSIHDVLLEYNKKAMELISNN
jgi:predicted dehydrogenase